MTTPDDDPMREVGDILAAREAAEKAAARISEARALMVSFKVPGVAKPALVFYTALLLRLEPVCRPELGTMATDGEKLFYSPDFVLGLKQHELFGVLAHETLHPALGHHARRDGREQADFNDACDLVINPMLQAAGFRLPATGRFPGKPPYEYVPGTENLSCEEVYDLIQEHKKPPPPPPPDPQQGDQGSGEDEEQDAGGEGDESGPDEEQPDEEQGEGEGGGDAQQQPGQGEAPADPAPDPGGCGGVLDPGDGSPADARESESRWQVAVAQAAEVARKMGSLPGGLERLIGEVLQPKEDWREVLREFVSRQARTEHSWSRPNRRYFQQGIYLPSLRGCELGDVVVAIDTSGSIRERELSLFAAELQAILEAYSCTLTVLYHDSEIQGVQHWTPSDGPLALSPVGGGGTSHVPVFDWLAEHDTGDAPCLVAFTDLATEFPSRAPDLPVLWACVGEYHHSVRPPFGRVVTIEKGGRP
jgi:predicted metal-dependent peptidase